MELLAQLLVSALEIFGELLLQCAAEALFELFGHAIAEPFKDRPPLRPWLAAIGYLIFGMAAGGASLIVFPALFIQAGWVREANLLVTPILSGLIMEAVGGWRARRTMEVVRLESFAYGFFFALGMACIRYYFGH